MPRSRKKDASKNSFKHDQTAIAKSLIGKPVPKKYRKEYGKRYGKVTSMEAAGRIKGSILKKKKAANSKKKR